MNLWLQIVEHGDLVLAGHQLVHEVGADVTGAAGDENVTNAHRLLGSNFH